MIAELLSTIIFIGYISFGAFIRILLGVYKAYDTFPDFKPEMKRLVAEMLFSICFGAVGVLILSELHMFNFGLEIMAIIMGMLGPDTIRIITKKFGIAKPTEAIVSEQQMKYADLNEREIRALEYTQRYGRISNKVYQKINFVGENTAKRELKTLMHKGKLARNGVTKGVVYTAKKESGANSDVIRTSKSIARKSSGKAPNKNSASTKSRLQPIRRVFNDPEMGNN